MIIKHQISHCTGNVRKILQKVFFIHVNQMFKFLMVIFLTFGENNRLAKYTKCNPIQKIFKISSSSNFLYFSFPYLSLLQQYL